MSYSDRPYHERPAPYGPVRPVSPGKSDIPMKTLRSIDQAGANTVLDYDDGMGDFGAPQNPVTEIPISLAEYNRAGKKKSLWQTRKDLSNLHVPSDVVRHKRIQVITHNGRCLEFEQIWWSNGYKLVTASDLTFDRTLHYWFYRG